MKIGGSWRSVRTAARYCLIRSYPGTARSDDIHPLDALASPSPATPGCHHKPPDQSRA